MGFFYTVGMWRVFSVFFFFSAMSFAGQVHRPGSPHPGGNVHKEIKVTDFSATCKSLVSKADFEKPCTRWMVNFKAKGMSDVKDYEFFDRATINAQGIPSACQNQPAKDLVACISWWYAVKAKQENKAELIADLLAVPAQCREAGVTSVPLCIEKFYYEPGSFLYKPGNNQETPIDGAPATENAEPEG